MWTSAFVLNIPTATGFNWLFQIAALVSSHTLLLNFSGAFALVSGADAECAHEDFCKNTYDHRKDFTRIYWNLTEVPGDIPADAQRVFVYQNAITSVPAGVFSHLSLCNTIYLSHNQISNLEIGAFVGLKSLRFLDLGGNQLSTLKTGMFMGMNNMQRLHLAHNKISMIEEGAFQYFYFIQEIRLFYNRLTTLSPNILLNLPRHPLDLQIDGQDGATNRLVCRTLCWLKHEDLHNTIRLWNGYHPRCTDGGQWSSLRCGDQGRC